MNRRELVLKAFAISALSGAGHPLAAQAKNLPSSVAKVKRSIVVVGTYKETDSPRFQLRGSGFLVDQGQFVITNAHVLPTVTGLSDAPKLSVQLWQGDGQWQRRDVQVVQKSEIHDLALLRLDGPAGPALELQAPGTVLEGDDLAFMGFPIGGVLGFAPVTHRATVSAITTAAIPSPNAKLLKERAVRGLRESGFEIYQLDATAYPGNSGGPLFDPVTAQVVGVMNMVLIKGTRESALSQPSGISYAIPVRFVHELLSKVR